MLGNKHIIFALFLSTFFMATPASAVSWEVKVPQWITRIASAVQVKDEQVSEQSEDRRKEIACVALGVYYESRGESLQGQRAVASVIMNRTRSGKYPDTACKVIFQRGQFSFVRPNLDPKGPLWQQAVEIASTYLDKAPDVPHLSFTASRRIKGLRIGGHVFY